LTDRQRPQAPRKSSAATALYTAAFAPVPSARLTTITVVKPGVRAKARTESLIPDPRIPNRESRIPNHQGFI
jgi:hypothetical protein